MMNIYQEVTDWLDGATVCYATPGTENHSGNFYGDTHICKLTAADVVGLIETARDNWDWSESGNPERDAISAVLGDLQVERPE